MAYYGDFDFESEAKYATAPFEEVIANNIKRKEEGVTLSHPLKRGAFR